MPDELSSKLYDLLEEIETIVEKERDELPEVEIEFAKFEFDKYAYDDVIKVLLLDEDADFDERPIITSQNRITKKQISNDVKKDKILSEIENTDLFDDIVELINKELPERSKTIDTDVSEQTQNRGETTLKMLLRAAVDRLLEGGDDRISERKKTSLISSLIKETQDGDEHFEATFWIWGLGILFEEYRLTEHTKISKPNINNLSLQTEIDNTANRKLRPYNIPTLSVKHSFRAGNWNEISSEMEVITSLLRLISGASAQVVGYHIKPQSILKGDYKIWLERTGETDAWTVILEDEDKHKIRDFFMNQEDAFRNLIYGEIERHYLTIAFDRYENAAAYDETIEEMIASTIMSLEALYLKENEKSELSERLAQRAGVLLGYFGYQPIDVYNRIKKGYDVRSSYVHGTKSSGEIGRAHV